MSNEAKTEELKVEDEIERLKFLEKSIKDKIIQLNQKYEEVVHQIQYLEKSISKKNKIIFSSEQTTSQNQDQIHQDNMYQNSSEQDQMEEDFQQNELLYFEEDNEDAIEEEQYLKKQGKNIDMDEEIQNCQSIKNQMSKDQNSQKSQSNLFPCKLLQPKQRIQESSKKKRIASLLEPQKQYGFKKMKIHCNDTQEIIEKKKKMIDKYTNFVEVIRKEMPNYISDYGQIRYPQYVKKKVAFFSRYQSRGKLLQDMKIGAEAVAKWVKQFVEWPDQKLEKIDPNDTFEEYMKQKLNKSTYLIKKQFLNIEPNLNQLKSKQIPLPKNVQNNLSKNNPSYLSLKQNQHQLTINRSEQLRISKINQY